MRVGACRRELSRSRTRAPGCNRGSSPCAGLSVVGHDFGGEALDEELGQGRDAVKQLLVDNPELAKEIEAKIREKIKEMQAS